MLSKYNIYYLYEYIFLFAIKTRVRQKKKTTRIPYNEMIFIIYIYFFILFLTNSPKSIISITKMTILYYVF